MLYNNLPLASNVEQTAGAEDAAYFVFVEGGKAPKKPHPNRFLAEKEARRLVAMLPGSTVHLMKVRSTYVNTDPAPEKPVKLDRDARLVANFSKQMAARAGMEPGDWVKVKDGHYAHAGEMGIIDRLGDAATGDSSVYVRIALNSEPQRFSPSSLTVQSPKRKAEEPAKVQDEGVRDEARVGDIFTAAINNRDFEVLGMTRDPSTGRVNTMKVRDILTNDVLPMTAPFNYKIKLTAEQRLEASNRERERAAEADAKSPFKALGPLAMAVLGTVAKAMIARAMENAREDDAGDTSDPEQAADFEAARAIPEGTEVVVIHKRHQIMEGLGAVTAIVGKKVRNDADDNRFVWVAFQKDDESYDEPRKVNGSRGKRADDPALMGMPA